MKKFLAVPLLMALNSAAHAAPLRIENETLAVSVDGDAFTVQSKPAGKTVLREGKLSGTGGAARKVAASDKTFGKGQSIEVSYPNGNRDALALYPGVPFLMLRTTLRNGGAEPQIIQKLPSFSGAVELGIARDKIRTLGTGGLLTPDKNPGSYAFLSIVDPATRGGIVGGWITHERGSGVVFSPVDGENVRMQAQIDYGRLRIAPGQSAETETFALGYFDDARLGLEAYADAVAKFYNIKLPPHRPGFCTWYMEKHAGASDEKHLAELSEYAAKNLKPYGFDFVQIDDNWQEGIGGNGPKKNFTTHAPKGPYPSGMKAAADNISRLGMTPGIWFMPFAGNHRDPLFIDHQEWFAKGPDGKPYETPWGGTCLDMTQPGAQEHLRSVVKRIEGDWGYRLFKMDGMWTGTATRQIYVNNGYKDDAIGEATLSNPDKTHIEAYRDGIKLVRATAGNKVFLLGCCVSQNMRSFGGAFGLLDAMRVGPDTGSGEIGAPHASRLWFTNGRIWHNDPDCVAVRASYPLGQARLNATFTAIADNVFYNSDWMPDFPAERLDILRRTMPAHGQATRPVDVFESDIARIWLVTDSRETRRRDVVALYNWEKQSATVEAGAARIGLPPAKQYVGFDFWANQFVPPFSGELRADLPAKSCRVLAIRPATDFPQLISTSRHVTQGIVDVRGEKWDAKQRTLSATSQIVGEDPYELRVIVPTGAKSWKATALNVSEADAAAGVKTEIKQDGPRLRATITSPQNRAVQWTLKFEVARIDSPAPPAVTGLKATADFSSVALSWDVSNATSYRVTREGAAQSAPAEKSAPTQTAAPQFTDSAAKLGGSYRYSVAALGWDGTAAAPVTIEVKMPDKIIAPATPPLPDVFLDAVTLKVEKNGWGKAGINKNVAGGALQIGGKTYDKGVGVHANASAVCPIPAGAKRFVSVVGIDDDQKADPRASVVFQVFGDVKELGESPVLLGQSPPLSDATLRTWAFDLALNTRYKELRLVVTDAGDGIAADHASWCAAGFVTK